MLAYLLRRLWQTIPTLLGVVLLVFFLFRKFGVDPAQTLASLNATPREIAEIRQQLGLNEPWWAQLGLFIKGIVTFDWGRSWATNETIAHLMATRLPATLTVTIPILILDTLIAIPIALGVAYVRGSLTDRAVMVGNSSLALRYGTNLMLRAIGRSNTRYMSDLEAAQRWLLSPLS